MPPKPKNPPKKQTLLTTPNPTKITKPKTKNPKNSHLYTDDNPRTTLHGTGFKDAPTAQHTLSLIKRRSLTYQFQTVNTLYHRAKHHPASRSNAGMAEAMGIFKQWLDETYPAAKRQKRGFRPLLSKACVGRYLPRIEEEVGDGEGAEFARVYVGLGKGRKLGNVLVVETEPGGADWEGRREEVLSGLVKEDGEEEEELWSGDGEVSGWHLRLIAWGWSPVVESKIP